MAIFFILTPFYYTENATKNTTVIDRKDILTTIELK